MIVKDTRTKAQRVADANAVAMTRAMALQFLKTALSNIGETDNHKQELT